MLLKIIIFLIILFIIYKVVKKIVSKPSNKDIYPIDTLVECKKCHTFVSKKEAIIRDGSYFCCRDCLDN
jgi:uncharacterized protein